MKVTLKRLLQRWTICVCKCTTFSWYWPLRLLTTSRQKGFAISCSYEWYCAKHAQPSTIFFFFLISHVVEKSFSFGSWKQTTLPKSLKSLDDLTATHEYQTITSWQRPKSSQGAFLLLLAIVEPLGCKIIVIFGCRLSRDTRNNPCYNKFTVANRPNAAESRNYRGFKTRDSARKSTVVSDIENIMEL